MWRVLLLFSVNFAYAGMPVYLKHHGDSFGGEAPYDNKYPTQCGIYVSLPYKSYECDISTDIPKQKRNFHLQIQNNGGDTEYIHIYNNLNTVLSKKYAPQQGDIIGYIDDINNIEIIKVDCRKCFLRKYGHLDMYEFEIDKTELENFNQKTDPIYEIIDYNHISP